MATPKERQFAELQYGRVGDRQVLEISIPAGTKIRDFGKIREFLNPDVLSKFVPRGCPACLSGESLIIREHLEHVVRIDLDRLEVIDRIGGPGR